MFERAERRDRGTPRRANAHERCRRFESAPAGIRRSRRWRTSKGAPKTWRSPAPSTATPRTRSASSAAAQRTRGLFLDRRAFLVVLRPDAGRRRRRDPRAHPRGRRARSCAGINLEYYFSYVDPAGYGCGTKLPHNITSLLGVMDGAQSDLRTGLPWQMVEIHEPVRLLIVVETTPDRVAASCRQSGHRATGAKPLDLARLPRRGLGNSALGMPFDGFRRAHARTCARPSSPAIRPSGIRASADSCRRWRSCPTASSRRTTARMQAGSST